MGFIDDAVDLVGKGAAAVRNTVVDVAIEQIPFMRDFCRMCSEGYALGFHERNGGNASYRLTEGDVSAARPFLDEVPGAWTPLSVSVPQMAGEYLLVTAAGKFLKNVAIDCKSNCGIVELDGEGAAWRIVWGFADNAHPTSEMPAHVAAQGVRKAATNGASRVAYHAHPSAVVALTALVDPDARTVSRILWKSLTESLIAIPHGIAVVPWMVPGSAELAQASCEALATFDACVWQLHGVFATGASCDEALGLVHAVDKAAGVYLSARAASGGAEPAHSLADDDLRAMARAYDLPINEDFLD